MMMTDTNMDEYGMGMVRWVYLTGHGENAGVEEWTMDGCE